MGQDDGFSAVPCDASALGSANAETAEAAPVSSDLLPCPFCGGPASEPTRYNGTMATGCDGPHDCPGTDVLAPVGLWNRRAPLLAAEPDMLAALEAAHHALTVTHNLRATDLSRDAFEHLGCDNTPADLEWWTDNSAELALVEAAISKALGQ